MRTLAYGAALIAVSIAGIATPAQAAPLPTRIQATLMASGTRLADSKWVRVQVFVPGAGCGSAPPVAFLPGTLTFKLDGQVVGSDVYPHAIFVQNCASDAFYVDTSFYVFAGFGDHVFTVEYSGSDVATGSISNAVSVHVDPDYVTASLKAGAADPQSQDVIGGFSCGTRQMGAPSSAVPPPAGITFPAGVVSYKMSQCGYGCGFLCPPGVPDFPFQRVELEATNGTDGGTAWVYNSGNGQAAPTWRPLQDLVRNGKVSANITGNSGENSLEGLIAISPAPAPATALQDVWWGGTAQNGWGVSFAQSGDALFGGLYVYSSNGTPVWAMFPGGTWNAARTQITGNLYTPFIGNGVSFSNYDPRKLQVGTPIGTATVNVTGPSAATLDYTIGGQSGRKSIQRFAMGTDLTPGRFAGLWWGGITQNGWGLQVQQQGGSAFVVWFTYDRFGSATWFVMSNGVVDDAASTITGTLYATTSSSWLAGYDSSRLALREVGTLKVQLDAPDVAKMAYSVDGVSGTNRLYRFPL